MKSLLVRLNAAAQGPTRPHRARVALGSCVVLTSALLAMSGGMAAASSAPPKVFAVGDFSEFSTLDPDQAITEDQVQVLNLIGAGLTKFDPDGTHIGPDLASSWKISANQRTYTFTLKPGLEFSDGSPLQASDIVASYTREINDKTNVNSGEITEWQSWSAPNPSTVVLQLKAPDASTLSFLADPEVGTVFPAARVKEGSFFLGPISAGRYKISSFDPSTGNTTLIVNPHYYGTRPAVPEINFVYIADPTTRIDELKSGQIDFAESLDPDTLSQLSGSTVGTLNKLYGGLYLDVNDRTGPLANVRVRQAISDAINRQQLNNVIFDGKDQVMTSFWPPTDAGGNQDVLPPYSVANAKSLLVGTPCAKGCTLTVMIRTGSSIYQDEATIIQQDLDQVGIKTELQLTDPSVANQKAIKGDFELYTGGLWDYANRPDEMLGAGLEYNGGLYSLYSGYNSPAMNALTNAALTTSGASRAKAIDEIGVLFAKNMPYIPLLDDVFANGQTANTTQWVISEPTTFFATPGV